MENEHYIYGASNADTWRTCKGSAKAVGLYAESAKAKEADWTTDGTEAHEWAEKVLRGECQITEIPSKYAVVREYVEYCEALKSEQWGVEDKVPLFYSPENRGTVDFYSLKDGVLHIVDYKNGAGKKVDSELNNQACIYALSLIQHVFPDLSDETPVHVTIYQPNHFSWTGEPNVWETHVRELRDIGIDIETDYQDALSATADDLTPHADACQFCELYKTGKCKAQIHQIMKDAPDNVNPFKNTEDFSDDYEITDEVLEWVYKNQKAVTKWFTNLMGIAQTRTEAGETTAFKMVAGKQGNLAWTDEEEAEKMIARMLKKDERTKSSLLTPTQIAKKINLEEQSTRFKNKWGEVTARKQGSPKMVLSHEKGEALPTAAQEFEDTETEVTADDLI